MQESEGHGIYKKRRTDTYDDIIGLPHHVSRRRRRMSMGERAAQFSPFAALGSLTPAGGRDMIGEREAGHDVATGEDWDGCGSMPNGDVGA